MSAPVLHLLFLLTVFLYPNININARVLNRSFPLIPKGRIIGGQKAFLHSAPFMVFIVLQHNPDNGEHFICGGTLISHKHVITAAHCLLRPGVMSTRYMILGATNRRGYESGQKLALAAKYFIYPRYGGITDGSKRHDLAIIELRTSVTFDNNIQPLALPTDDKTTYVGQKARAYGWGMTQKEIRSIPDILNYVDLPVIPTSVCGTQKNCHTQEVYDGDLCTSGVNHKQVFNGDSGGPLVFNNTLIGVTSRGPHCDEPPSIFTAISNHLEWIKAITMFDM